MSLLDKLLPDFTEEQRAERNRVLGLIGMFCLVVMALWILKPAKNALALSGLASGEFYKTYLVSAVVVLFVPIYDSLADRVGWRTLVPAVAVFFAANLLVFRLFYEPGSTLFGLAFYGWYDLFSAALVTQFFAATQMVLTARTARSAYPLVIGGGALGAIVGSLISFLLADPLGTENLLLVASAFILVFGLGITFVWPEAEMSLYQRERAKGVRRKERVSKGDLRRVFSNSHVRLIAVSVLIAILTKQLVDYLFNTLTEEWYYGDTNAITRYQAVIGGWTQFLLLISVAALGPILRNWGLGVVVFLLPTLMLAAGLGMVAVFSLATATMARMADVTLRYTAERAGREILYVPVPEAIKLKAKTYIDVGLEKGAGKALSAFVIFALVDRAGLSTHQIAVVVAALAAGWVVLTLALRREYVRTLASSIRGRFASFQGLSTLSDASTQKVVRRALSGEDAVQTSFALDLVGQSAGTDNAPIAEALHDLLEHEQQDVRRKAVGILARDPRSMDQTRVRAKLLDQARAVREQAVLALVGAREGDARNELVRELLASPHAQVRTATLACLTRGAIQGTSGELLGQPYLEERWQRAQSGDRDARIELALAAGALGSDPRAVEMLRPFLKDPDPAVASAAIRSAGLLRHPELQSELVAGLGVPSTREAAREALAEQGATVVDVLAAYLLDETAHPLVRRHIPSVLARIPDQKAVDLMLHSVIAPETDQLLDYRTLKALSKLRVRHLELRFDAESVLKAVAREVEAAGRYEAARRALAADPPAGPAAELLARSLEEAWVERREGAFRLLGLLYPPEEMYRCYLALAAGERVSRGNALEWLDETLGRTLFERLDSVLREGRREVDTPALRDALPPLTRDGDPLIARLALATTADLGQPWSRDALRGIIDTHPNEEFRALARRRSAPSHEARAAGDMDLIEKVFLLQKIDLLQDARSAHLALLASIAEEVEVDRGTVLIRQDEPTDALYVVIDGRVELRGVTDQVIEAKAGRAFGTWALIDEAPSLVTATALAHARLLRITRADFYDLLADHSELALGLLQGLARRVRTLVA